MKKRKILFTFFTIILLVSGIFAQDEENNYKPVNLGNGAQIINESFKEKNDERLFELSADYPQIVGINTPNARKFNELAKEKVMKQLDNFRKFLMEMDEEELKFTKEREIDNYSDIGYGISLANQNIISVYFGNGTYAGGAHPNANSFVLNYDLKNGKELSLADLFLPNSNYLKKISDYSIKDLKKQGSDEFSDDEWIARGAGAKLENYRSWNLTEEGLQITFDQYQVAAYVAGPQEVTIPYSELRGILKTFDFAPLQYANNGNPVNWCRNGLFPKDSENFRIAKITGTKNEKVFFYADDNENCPKSANCKMKSYVIPNDEVIVSRTYGNFACSWYQPKKGSETVGWIELSKLDFVENAENLPWIGDWNFYDNSIKIAPMKLDGKVKITGNAFWKGLGDNIHIGEIDFSGIPENNKLSLGDAGEYECRVKMQRVGKFLIVSDNLNCGGANVSFNGVYQR